MTTRKLWLLDQIEKCDELLTSGKLSEFQSAMVHVLRVDFVDSLQILKSRNDDGDGQCECKVIQLPRRARG